MGRIRCINDCRGDRCYQSYRRQYVKPSPWRLDLDNYGVILKSIISIGMHFAASVSIIILTGESPEITGREPGREGGISMKWMKGIFLLLVANILIMVTLSLTVPVLINVVLPMFGLDLRGVVDLTSLVWALAFGFGGAFISLAFSKQMARAMLDCRQIIQPRSHADPAIYGTVQEIAQRLQITMPEVWIYESPDPNAFATGPSKNNSMVAVSTGLLSNLQEQEVRAVLAHEMGH